MINMEWISTILSHKLCKKMEQNLHETTSWFKIYGKQLFSKDLKV
jgi:hypothetical protein